MPIGRYGAGPWYRGGVSRSYVPPTIFVSVGYAICLVFFAIFFILAGSIMTGVANQDLGPRFDDDFFKKHRDSSNIFKTIGPVLLGIGFTLLAIAISLCVAAACLAKKQEDKRHNQQQQSVQPLTATVPFQPPPASAYPHQQAPENFYPAAPNYSTQPVGQFPPGNSYPQQQPQSQYPPQPPSYYPPTSSYMPPSVSPYPPSYPPIAPNIIPENSYYTSADEKPHLESTKQIT